MNNNLKWLLKNYYRQNLFSNLENSFLSLCDFTDKNIDSWKYLNEIFYLNKINGQTIQKIVINQIRKFKKVDIGENFLYFLNS